MVGGPREAPAFLSVAAILFFVAALVLVSVTFDYALAPPGTSGLIEYATDHQLRWLRVALFGITLCIVVTGTAFLWIGWTAAREGRRAAVELERQGLALEASERRYRNTFEHAVVGLLRVAADGTVQDANRAVADMLGYAQPSDLIGRSVTTLYRDPRDRDRMLADLGTSSVIAGVALQWQRLDGRPLTVRVTSRVERDALGIVAGFDDLVEDVTERVALGEQLRHAQKMEAVGRLAGGIAHDFNNLLTVILGHVELLASETGMSTTGAHSVDQIRHATSSASTVTRQLLMFSRRSATSPQSVDVNRAVAYVEKMIARLIGEDIRVFSNLSGDTATIMVDPAHLEQALINLAVNARDAMPQGGVLIFETAVAAEGRRVRIAVRDTGHGMDETTRQRAFEPFFTTKSASRSSGLGLSMVYGFVRQADGEVTITSTPQRGTTVALDFPAMSSAVAIPEPAGVATLGGHERVLVVEDQDSVRTLVSGILEKRGFKVVQAGNAREARRVLAADPAIDLVLSDIVMPGESGLELGEWLSTAYPHIAVTFMSGYSDHPAMHDVPSDHLLVKPFTPAMLVTHVRTALDVRPPHPAGAAVAIPTTAA